MFNHSASTGHSLVRPEARTSYEGVSSPQGRYRGGWCRRTARLRLRSRLRDCGPAEQHPSIPLGPSSRYKIREKDTGFAISPRLAASPWRLIRHKRCAAQLGRQQGPAGAAFLFADHLLFNASEASRKCAIAGWTNISAGIFKAALS